MPYLLSVLLIKGWVHRPEAIQLSHDSVDEESPGRCITSLKFIKIMLQDIGVMGGNLKYSINPNIRRRIWTVGSTARRVRSVGCLHGKRIRYVSRMLGDWQKSVGWQAQGNFIQSVHSWHSAHTLSINVALRMADGIQECRHVSESIPTYAHVMMLSLWHRTTSNRHKYVTVQYWCRWCHEDITHVPSLLLWIWTW